MCHCWSDCFLAAKGNQSPTPTLHADVPRPLNVQKHTPKHTQMIFPPWKYVALKKKEKSNKSEVTFSQNVAILPFLYLLYQQEYLKTLTLKKLSEIT